MTYAEALTLRGNIESALSEGGAYAVVQIGDRSVTYSTQKARDLLAQVNRDIAAYESRAAGRNPTVKVAKWRR